MCDYSAEHVKRRDAAVGNTLTTARISQHTTGLVSSADPTTAVCLLPDTTMIVSGVPKDLQKRFGVREVARATFMQKQLPAGKLGFRDGIAFAGAPSKFILLNELPLGLEMSVEQIGAKTVYDQAPAHTRESVAA